MSRRWVWLQLAIGWLPVWALYTTLITAAHGETDLVHAALIALRAIGAAAVLGYFVAGVTERFPWPSPIRLPFLLLHLTGAILYAFAWVGLTSLIESALRWQLVIVMPPSGMISYLILGIWIYIMVAGVTYAARGTERAARAEAMAARSQLAALRSQLNPHFLFNALHTVVQLIPREPKRAAQAAEQIAGLLRTALEEEHDLVPLERELAFVERYLEIERIRFGDRLRVRIDVPAETRASLIPAFALQSLVENAVRHGAAPRIEPTEVSITARVAGRTLVIEVADTGAGTTPDQLERGSGTGLRRLRERLAVLYGSGATLEHRAGPNGTGLTARLVLPLRDAD
jgi:signal transduction histidine kinase